MAPEAGGRFATLAKHLEILASETRLEILHALRTPHALHEIRVSPSLTRVGQNEDRSLSRQAVTRHLELMVDAGILQRTAAPGGRGEAYVLNHERLFALVDEMHTLAKLRPAGSFEPGATMDRGVSLAPLPDAGPRLVVAYGRDEGVAFPLDARTTSRWRIGRQPGCEIRLDYDPYLSGENTIVESRSAGFVVRDLGSRNGTSLNWRALRRDDPTPLRAGDILTVGRSLLVFQT